MEMARRPDPKRPGPSDLYVHYFRISCCVTVWLKKKKEEKTMDDLGQGRLENAVTWSVDLVTPELGDFVGLSFGFLALSVYMCL